MNLVPKWMTEKPALSSSPLSAHSAQESIAINCLPVTILNAVERTDAPMRFVWNDLRTNSHIWRVGQKNRITSVLLKWSVRKGQIKRNGKSNQVQPLSPTGYKQIHATFLSVLCLLCFTLARFSAVSIHRDQQQHSQQLMLPKRFRQPGQLRPHAVPFPFPPSLIADDECDNYDKLLLCVCCACAVCVQPATTTTATNAATFW